MEYISLFSSGGFDCIATSELIERRLNIQKINNKVKYDNGYILGDITQKNTKNKLFNAITFFKNKEKINDITDKAINKYVMSYKKKIGIIIGLLILFILFCRFIPRYVVT
jgi:hypothetical protein